ncbi:hypothetical protein ACFY12_04305 [Streptomyces sp. NPDC001339]|uniref:hypothetical protein n=1 Tax=Streptomyces sp. NPDC001339 TaxID=3364563 RepID=UPI0036897878
MFVEAIRQAWQADQILYWQKYWAAHKGAIIITSRFIHGYKLPKADFLKGSRYKKNKRRHCRHCQEDPVPDRKSRTKKRNRKRNGIR